MVTSKEVADASIRQDRARHRKELADWETAGLGNSESAKTLRGWIGEEDYFLANSRR